MSKMKVIKNYDEVSDEYSLIKMCGRMVEVRKRKDGEFGWTRNGTYGSLNVLGEICADCNSPAPFLIRELGEDSTWCYCGICEIGG